MELTPLARRLSVDDAVELACKAHLGVWSERKRGLLNGAHHWEWCELEMRIPRLAVIAPREHAKSEVFAVNATCWRARYLAGMWTYVFSSTSWLAQQLLTRIVATLEETDPWMVSGASQRNMSEITFANGSRVTVAGAGTNVRGAHPDRIVGDDVLEEGNTLTHLQRKRVERWWFGTVGGMSHPGTWRTLPGGRKVWMAPTIARLVGTPFHQQDLLMSMRDNPVWKFYRYSAEYDASDLVEGMMAVEVA